MNCCALRPCFIDHLFSVSDFCQLPCQYLFQFFPFFFQCFLCIIWNFFGSLRHRKKLMYQVDMAQGIYSFCSEVTLMIPLRYTFQSYSQRLVGIDNTSVFCLVFPCGKFLRGNLLVSYKALNFPRASLLVCLDSSSSGSMTMIVSR